MTDTNKLVHSTASHVLRDDNRSRNTIHLSKSRLTVFIADLREVLLRVRKRPGHSAFEGLQERDVVDYTHPALGPSK